MKTLFAVAWVASYSRTVTFGLKFLRATTIEEAEGMCMLLIKRDYPNRDVNAQAEKVPKED